MTRAKVGLTNELRPASHRSDEPGCCADGQEQRVDEALKETFPASDPPAFIKPGARDRATDRPCCKSSREDARR